MATSMVKREEGAQARQTHPVNETGLAQEVYSGNITRNKQTTTRPQIKDDKKITRNNKILKGDDRTKPWNEDTSQ